MLFVFIDLKFEKPKNVCSETKHLQILRVYISYLYVYNIMLMSHDLPVSTSNEQTIPEDEDSISWSENRDVKTNRYEIYGGPSNDFRGHDPGGPSSSSSNENDDTSISPIIDYVNRGKGGEGVNPIMRAYWFSKCLPLNDSYFASFFRVCLFLCLFVRVFVRFTKINYSLIHISYIIIIIKNCAIEKLLEEILIIYYFLIDYYCSTLYNYLKEFIRIEKYKFLNN